MKAKPNLGEGHVGKLLLSLSVPTVTAQLINMLYSIVDRIYIGHIEGSGYLALTGLGLCFPLIMIVTAFSNLIGGGGAPKAAIAMGKGKNEDAEAILGNCVVALAVVAVLLTCVFTIFGEKLLFLFGASDLTILYALDYLNIYSMGNIFVLTTLVLNAFITTQGFTKISMLTIVIGAILNIILDPIFIYGFNMGVKGAALATVISQAVSATWVLRFLCSEKSIIRIKLKNMKLQPAVILSVMALGASPFVMASTESLLNITFNSSLSKYGGDVAVGTMTILSSSYQMVLVVINGLSQGAQPILSYNYGAGNYQRVRQTFKVLFVSAVTCSTISFVLVQVFAPLFVSIFSSEPDLMELATWALRIYLGGVFVMGVQNACQMSFLALGQAKISLFLACLRKLILLIPLIYILPNFFEDKLFAVFLAEPISDITAACCTGFAFYMMFPRILNQTEKTKNGKEM